MQVNRSRMKNKIDPFVIQWCLLDSAKLRPWFQVEMKLFLSEVFIFIFFLFVYYFYYYYTAHKDKNSQNFKKCRQ